MDKDGKYYTYILVLGKVDKFENAKGIENYLYRESFLL